MKDKALADLLALTRHMLCPLCDKAGTVVASRNRPDGVEWVYRVSCSRCGGQAWGK